MAATVLALSVVSVPAAAAETSRCRQLAEELLARLAGSSARSIEAEAERQREVLRSRGCDPLSSGYDVEVEERKLNSPGHREGDGEPPVRLDRLIRIPY